MSDICKWLHEQLECLPVIRFPFSPEQLPWNGIYFFYEDTEISGHDIEKLRIVRVGTHKDGNFRSRIAEHYLLDESKMNFDATKPAPKDRSIFRKNIGRALLNRSEGPYLKTWEIDFTKKDNRDNYGRLRDIEKEKKIEREVTQLLRNQFSFRFIILEQAALRMGSNGLECSLIGTVARCGMCKPSGNWLGNYSPKEQVRSSGLWLVQHLRAKQIDDRSQQMLLESLAATRQWCIEETDLQGKDRS